jgi:hypothetical protein
LTVQILNDAAELVEYVERLFDYDAGFQEGAADANLISQPINTNGHTFEVYSEIMSRAVRIYLRVECEGRDAPPYFQGYCDGCDEVALCGRGERPNLALQLKEA